MRKEGDVRYCDVHGDVGYVEYMHYDDMKHAIKYLDDTKLISGNESSYIRVRRDRDRSRSRSRYSRSSRRDRSYSHSPRRDRSRSRDEKHDRSNSRDEKVRDRSPSQPEKNEPHKEASRSPSKKSESPKRSTSPKPSVSRSRSASRSRSGSHRSPSVPANSCVSWNKQTKGNDCDYAQNILFITALLCS